MALNFENLIKFLRAISIVFAFSLVAFLSSRDMCDVSLALSSLLQMTHSMTHLTSLEKAKLKFYSFHF